MNVAEAVGCLTDAVKESNEISRKRLREDETEALKQDVKRVKDQLRHLLGCYFDGDEDGRKFWKEISSDYEWWCDECDVFIEDDQGCSKCSSTK